MDLLLPIIAGLPEGCEGTELASIIAPLTVAIARAPAIADTPDCSTDAECAPPQNADLGRGCGLACKHLAKVLAIPLHAGLAGL